MERKTKERKSGSKGCLLRGEGTRLTVGGRQLHVAARDTIYTGM